MIATFKIKTPDDVPGPYRYPMVQDVVITNANNEKVRGVTNLRIDIDATANYPTMVMEVMAPAMDMSAVLQELVVRFDVNRFGWARYHAIRATSAVGDEQHISIVDSLFMNTDTALALRDLLLNLLPLDRFPVQK